MTTKFTIEQKYWWLLKNRLVMQPASREGPSYPSLYFSYDIWHQRPETHTPQGLDAAIEKTMNE